MLITSLNCYSVYLATGTQNVFTLAKLLAIVVIVIGGAVRLFQVTSQLRPNQFELTTHSQGQTEHLSTGFAGSKWSIADIATAFYSGLWAYDGW